MSAVSREDFKRILLFCVHLAKVDQDFSFPEKKLLSRFAEALKLGETERAELLASEFSLVEGLKELVSKEARELLVKCLCLVSYADGTLDKEEVAFIEKVMRSIDQTIFILPKEEWGNYESEVFSVVQAATGSSPA